MQQHLPPPADGPSGSPAFVRFAWIVAAYTLLRDAVWPRLLHLVLVDAAWMLLVLLGSTVMVIANNREAARREYSRSTRIAGTVAASAGSAGEP